MIMIELECCPPSIVNCAREQINLSRMSAKEVAQSFANHYYNLFGTNRANLASLYVSKILNLLHTPFAMDGADFAV